MEWGMKDFIRLNLSFGSFFDIMKVAYSLGQSHLQPRNQRNPNRRQINHSDWCPALEIPPIDTNGCCSYVYCLHSIGKDYLRALIDDRLIYCGHSAELRTFIAGVGNNPLRLDSLERVMSVPGWGSTKNILLSWVCKLRLALVGPSEYQGGWKKLIMGSKFSG